MFNIRKNSGTQMHETKMLADCVYCLQGQTSKYLINTHTTQFLFNANLFYFTRNKNPKKTEQSRRMQPEAGSIKTCTYSGLPTIKQTFEVFFH